MNRTKKMLAVSFVSFILGGATQLAGQAASEKSGE
jgi:hypothetical protein